MKTKLFLAAVAVAFTFAVTSCGGKKAADATSDADSTKIECCKQDSAACCKKDSAACCKMDSAACCKEKGACDQEKKECCKDKEAAKN